MYNSTYKEFIYSRQIHRKKKVELRLTESGGRNEW